MKCCITVFAEVFVTVQTAWFQLSFSHVSECSFALAFYRLLLAFCVFVTV